MKTILCMALLIIGVSAHGGILDIKHPAVICPSDNPLFTAEYKFMFNISGPPQERVMNVKWQFIQNGTVIKTLNSTGFDQFTPLNVIGKATIFAGSLPAGAITAKVTIVTSMSTGFGIRFNTYTFAKAFTVGITKPVNIDGPIAVCSGATSTFSTPAIAGVSSYTWKVPAGWKVNGITGPVVAGQGNTVTITNNGTKFLSYPISVAGVSTSCGTSPYYSENVFVDYSFSIYPQDLGAGVIRLSVNGHASPSYTWQIPSTWSMIANHGTYIEVNTHFRAGTASVTLITPCGTSATEYYQNAASGCDPTIQVYPTEFVDHIMLDPGSAMIMDLQMIDFSGNLQFLNFWMEGYLYHINTALLPPGAYILKVMDGNGCVSDFRVTKL